MGMRFASPRLTVAEARAVLLAIEEHFGNELEPDEEKVLGDAAKKLHAAIRRATKERA